MINLLPPELRSSYHYAHSNTILLRWVIAGAFAIGGLLIIGLSGILYTQQTTKSLDTQVSDLQSTLEEPDLDKTKAETENISGSIKLAVTVLSKEIMFSKLLEKLGNITPNNTSLTDLNISQEQQGVDITAQTTDYNAATQLQINLSDPANKLFEKADIVSITCNSSQTSEEVDARYPCTAVIRALFVKDNPFLFINNEAKKP